MKAALSVKPKTPAEAVLPYLPLCSLILVMTVEPGFGGQSFMEDMMPKVQTIRGWIEKDGLGCNACALCALTDAPFAKAFLEDLPELAAQHEDILQELTRQTERVNKRRQEEKAHRKNVRFGKK